MSNVFMWPKKEEAITDKTALHAGWVAGCEAEKLFIIIIKLLTVGMIRSCKLIQTNYLQ